MEAAYAQELDLRVKAGDIKSWKRQVKIDLRAYGKHICNYYIDFVIKHNDETEEFLEIKGMETPEWRLKWKLFCAQMEEENPAAKLTVVK